MSTLLEKFAKLGCDNAPGQESLQKQEELPVKGENLPGVPVDFSHGDVVFGWLCAVGTRRGGNEIRSGNLCRFGRRRRALFRPLSNGERRLDNGKDFIPAID